MDVGIENLNNVNQSQGCEYATQQEVIKETVLKLSSTAVFDEIGSPGVDMEESEGFVILSKNNSPRDDGVLLNIPIDTDTINWSDYNAYNGEVYNVNTVFKVLTKVLANLPNYGANTTVNYFTVNFREVSSFSSCFPVLKVGRNDFMLFEVTVPNDEEWLSQHNLFNFTPYFFDYVDPDTKKSTNVFASCDNTVPFFKDMTPGTVRKICCTACKTVADEFAAQGYEISHIPAEYLNDCTYMHLIRVGILHDSASLDTNCKIPHGMVKATYYCHESKQISHQNGSGEDAYEYFDSLQITDSFVRPLEPESTSSTRALHSSYMDALQLLANQCTAPGYSELQFTYNYLSQSANVRFAFQSFYDAMRERPPIEMLGNNTGENYFISDDVDVSIYADKMEQTGQEYYLYVLSVNQNAAKCGISSNIQIYNRSNNSTVDNGTYETSPPLPPFTADNYPFTYSTADQLQAYPGLVLSQHSVRALIDAGVTTVTVAERNAYHPRNFNYTSNDYVDTAVYFLGPQLPQYQLDKLRKAGCVVRSSKSTATRS
jgi:hypothetical protein